ncbi:MAG: type II toxin-antitoxin system VapC family toxin [Pseudomonadota bacterium]|nr:type II toxin-antitoxin system VapC family toxin [Pseudomonadota bacterium]
MLLDSNIIIYAAEPGYDGVRDFIAQQEPKISVISKVEVLGYHKLMPETQQVLERLFQVLPMLPVSNAIIEQAICLRQQHHKNMSLGDSLIAATALTHHLKLVTNNVKDFAWIEQLEIINPIRLG